MRDLWDKIDVMSPGLLCALLSAFLDCADSSVKEALKMMPQQIADTVESVVRSSNVSESVALCMNLLSDSRLPDNTTITLAETVATQFQCDVNSVNQEELLQILKDFELEILFLSADHSKQSKFKRLKALVSNGLQLISANTESTGAFVFSTGGSLIFKYLTSVIHRSFRI